MERDRIEGSRNASEGGWGVRRRGGGWGHGEGGTAKGEQGRGKILEPLDILDAGAPTKPCVCFLILF